jgi:hypothetical protein
MMDYYVQGFKDPITGIEGNDANEGSKEKPLFTLGEALRRAKYFEIKVPYIEVLPMPKGDLYREIHIDGDLVTLKIYRDSSKTELLDTLCVDTYIGRCSEDFKYCEIKREEDPMVKKYLYRLLLALLIFVFILGIVATVLLYRFLQ